MRDAYGGVANMAIIIVFLALVSGYLAFNVNYTKAFRVKNKIISTIEEYEGNCKVGDISNECHKKIIEYMNALGYNAPDLKLTDTEHGQPWNCGEGVGYCIKKIPVARKTTDTDDIKDRAYFKVVTQINIDIPIINKILPGLRIFQVSGDTKPIVIVSK